MASLEINEDLDLSNLTDKQKITMLDKVFFKILASETDIDFEDNLKIFLPKLILKLATNEEIVRKKVMEILVHINKRVRSRPTVQLPLEDLLEKFNDPNLASLSFVSNFSLIYIKLSFPRLSDKQKASMVERLLKCLEGKSPTHQDSLLSLIVDGIKYLELKQGDSSNKEKYGLENSPKLRKYLIDYLFCFLLLPYSSNTAPKLPPLAQTTTPSTTQLQTQAPQTSTPAPAPTQAATANTTPETPACLSESIYKRFKNDFNMDNGDEIEQLKIGILKFLSFNIYNCEEILYHFIVSTSDTRYSVVQIAEIHIKRIVGSVDLNDASIVNRLFHLFLGDKGLQKVQKPSNTAEVIEPANTRIRLKLFPYILRSRGASCTMPQAIQLVFDCLFGPATHTNQKIKFYAVQFVHLIALNCEPEKLTKLGGVLIQGLNKLIAETKDDSKLRGLAYVGIGKLSRKIPSTITNDISLVHSFFSALEKEDSDTKMHIQEALTLIIDAFRNSKNEDKDLLLTLLFQYIENDVSQCRSMAVKYAFEIFNQDHLESRFLLLLATSDAREEIRQEAVKYLRRFEDGDGNELSMASFERWVEFISSKMQDRLAKKYKCYTFGTHTLAFDPNCYQEILVVLRLALSKSANIKAQIIDSKSLESIREEAPRLASYVNKLAKQNLNCLFKYVNIIKEYALTVANSLGVYLLLEICSLSPFNVTKFLHDEVDWLKNQSFAVNEQLRFFSAELWSLVLVNNILDQHQQKNEQMDLSKVNFESLFSSLNGFKSILNNNSKSVETKHGSILCIGFAIGRYYSLTGCKVSDELIRLQLKNLISLIISFTDDANLGMAAIISLGEIARNGSLIYENFETKIKLVDSLNHKILTSKETNKVKERAAATLGYMCIHQDLLFDQNSSSTQPTYTIESKHFDTFNKYIMQKLLDSSQAKQIELHMAIGEALVNCALGKSSNASLNSWITNFDDETEISNTVDMLDLNKKIDEPTEDLVWLLNTLLNSYMPNPNQHLRQASCFWLLIFVKKTSRVSQIVAKNLFKIQDAFIQRLGENDEITQEVASKGIGVVFSMANDEQKKHLVSRIVDTLGGSKQKKTAANEGTTVSSAESGLKITDENEEIFQPDQIGKTPDGTNITTYKEICSLASDMNRPDLIYQFMNLAHHNSIWNTRRGAAFGFNIISQIARDQLQPYLASIVPKLFRYQFDPNPKIQLSMNSIWNSLIKQDNKKIVDQYLMDIIADIEENMLAPQWRVRESCCNALCDLLKGGRNLDSISFKFGSFWGLLFKLADDIKESVRVSAELALKSLQRVTISYSTSVSNVNTCQQTVNSVLPVLIKTGLQSSLQEIRNISVLTIRDLAKQTSAFMIRPYLVDMIISLLETLSGYEPPDLNYISLKLASQDAQEKLDLARISASKNTPMVEIINMNLEHLNEESIISELIPKLVEIIKRGLGVSTKAGVCNILCALVDQQAQLMVQYSGKLMAALVNSMSSESNKTINKCYCSTIGSICKVAKESSIENLLNKLLDWYLEKEDEGIRLSCGLTLLAIAQNNTEIIAKYSKKCIPFVFFAMHQPNESKLKANQAYSQKTTIWDDVWEEITSGTEYAIRANLSEILALLKIGLEHQSWNLRAQSALAICTVCSKLQSNIDSECLNSIIQMLNSALSTRTWSGKDKVLIAVSSLFINCKLKLSFENPLTDEIIKNIFKEANKQSDNIELNYRVCSLRCLADLVQFGSTHAKDSYFEQYFLIVKKYFEAEFEEVVKKERVYHDQLVEQFKNKNRKETGELEAKREKKDDSEMMEVQPVEKQEKDDKAKAEKDENDEEEEKKNEAIKLIILETIGKCWPYSTEIQEKYTFQTVLLLADYLNKVTWANQLQIIKSFEQVYDKWSLEFEEKSKEEILKIMQFSCASVISCIAKTNHSNLRREGLLLLEKVYKIIEHEKVNNKNWSKFHLNKHFKDELTSELVDITDANTKIYVSSFMLNKILDDLRVLLKEFSADSSIDIKEKSKSLLKSINSHF